MSGKPPSIDLNALSKSLQDLSAMIVDDSSSRKSIRVLLSKLNMKPGKVDILDDAKMTESEIKAKKPNILFINFNMVGSDGLRFVEIHKSVIASGQPRCFFLITQQDSLSAIGDAADAEVDAIISKPFTTQSLETDITQALFRKLNPTPMQKLLDMISSLVQAGNLDDASRTVEAAKKLGQPTPILHYYEGIIAFKLDRHADAQKAFEAGLAIQPIHYRCLFGLLDVLITTKEHSRAYEIAKTISTNYTVPVKKIPDLIRLSIVNSKYEDILDFYNVVSNMNEVEDTLSAHIAAGLVVCGTYLLKQKNDPENALKAYKKTETFSKGRPKIVKKIITDLFEANMETDADYFVSRAPDEVKDSAELEVARLEMLVRQNKSEDALNLALNLIRKKIPAPRAYHTAIKISIDIKRSRNNIEDLIGQATSSFPDLKSEFESYLSQLQ